VPRSLSLSVAFVVSLDVLPSLSVVFVVSLDVFPSLIVVFVVWCPSLSVVFVVWCVSLSVFAVSDEWFVISNRRSRLISPLAIVVLVLLQRRSALVMLPVAFTASVIKRAQPRQVLQLLTPNLLVRSPQARARALHPASLLLLAVRLPLAF
jgi:hypothetical protein